MYALNLRIRLASKNHHALKIIIPDHKKRSNLDWVLDKVRVIIG